MPTVDLTPRLARQSKPGPKDTFLFDRSLPGFGLRIHPSGQKVWIVQTRIERRSLHIIIALHCWRAVCSDAKLSSLRPARPAPHRCQPCRHVRREPAPARTPSARTTAGYAHLADAHLVEIAEKVGSIIAGAMDPLIMPTLSRPRERRRYGRWI